MSEPLPGGGQSYGARLGDEDSTVQANTESSRHIGATRPAPVPGSMFGDPAVRRMAWLAAFMLVAFLATIVGALFFGILNPPAPRTAVERDLAIAEAKIESNGADVTAEDWYKYTNALVATGQFGKAERMIQTAEAGGFEDPAKQYFGLVKTRLALARGDHELALRESESAMKALEAQLEVEEAAYEATKRPSVMIAEGLGVNHQTLQLLRAETLEALERHDEAIGELDAYLERNTRAADILVWRGDLKVASGDTAGAIDDYKNASTYLPGDDSLAEKLSALGASND